MGGGLSAVQARAVNWGSTYGLPWEPGTVATHQFGLALILPASSPLPRDYAIS
jgi:hypothetical protein